MLLPLWEAIRADDEASMGPGSDLELLLSAFSAMGVNMKRREYLRYLAASAATVASGAFFSTLSPELRERTARALARPDRVDLGTVEELRAAVGGLQQHSEGAMPYLRLVSAVGPHVVVVRRLLGGSQADQVRQAVCEVAIQTFNLAGRLAFNLRDHASAGQFAADADAVSVELHDGWMKQWWLSSRARVARFNHNDIDQALYFALEATTQDDRSSPFARSWSYCVLAEMYSLHGDDDKARKAIDLSRMHAQGNLEEDPAAHLFPESRFGGLRAVQARIGAYEGTCCLRTGRGDQAEPILTEALDGIPAGIEGQRSFLLADLATAYIRQHQPEQGAQALRQAIGIVGRTGAAIPTQRVHRARRELQPWRHERFVAELDELLLPAPLPL